MEIVYKALRRLVAHYMRAERADHTLQPTALVQLRFIVVDDARGRDTRKRGGLAGKIQLDDIPDMPLVIASGAIPFERISILGAQLWLTETDNRFVGGSRGSGAANLAASGAAGFRGTPGSRSGAGADRSIR